MVGGREEKIVGGVEELTVGGEVNEWPWRTEGVRNRREEKVNEVRKKRGREEEKEEEEEQSM